MQEKENIISILKGTKEALAEDDANAMKDLSNRTVHSAAIYQDPDNIVVAVIIYSLSKIIERKNYRDYPEWKEFYNSYLKSIDKSLSALEKNDIETFKKQMKLIRTQESKLSGNFREHIKNVFHRAQVNKASRIYEHGISMQKTADLLGISVWDLANYAGSTGISNVKFNTTIPETQRIKYVLELFEK